MYEGDKNNMLATKKAATQTNRVAVTTAMEAKARVYCYICTHSVEAVIEMRGNQPRTKPGQSCSRCATSLDSAYVMTAPHVG